mmetsp:Transcript_46708/g.84306  ORF Transcript_46708/g.84306 Transcript_46708/m.84306 type:complete len:147 (-) Transcript_46708:53-493(-)
MTAGYHAAPAPIRDAGEISLESWRQEALSHWMGEASRLRKPSFHEEIDEEEPRASPWPQVLRLGLGAVLLSGVTLMLSGAFQGALKEEIRAEESDFQQPRPGALMLALGFMTVLQLMAIFCIVNRSGSEGSESSKAAWPAKQVDDL